MILQIDGIQIDVPDGTSVLEAATQAGIVIPTMCYLKGVKSDASCMVCMVKDETTGKFFPSCAMPAAEGMKIQSDHPEVHEMRKQALELLLSDHVGDCEAPCRLACPAYMNIPLMNRLIAEGKFDEALEVVHQHIPLPHILGYICPAPCEKVCHRATHDSPVSICLLKRSTKQYSPNLSPLLLKERGTGGEILPPLSQPVEPGGEVSRIAIIGSGATGLSAAFYLLRLGYQCDIYEKEPELGGGLRYSIPEEQLPREVLDNEIAFIEKMGASFFPTQTITNDRFREMHQSYDALIVATGNMDHLTLDLNSDQKTGTTTHPKVFVAGDLHHPTKMAVKSVAYGHLAALQVDHFLSNNNTNSENQEISIRKFKFHSIVGRITKPEYEEYLKESNTESRITPKQGFLGGFSMEEAMKEAQRCMHCDCRKSESCKLRIYSEAYGAERRRFAGSSRKAVTKSIQHQFVIYESEKCIRCGLCVEISKKDEEALGMSYIGRGFDVRIAVPFHEELKEALKITAKDCVKDCPTGALAFKEGRNEGEETHTITEF